LSGIIAVLEIACFRKIFNASTSTSTSPTHSIFCGNHIMSHHDEDEDLRAAMEATSSPPPESPTPGARNATKRFHSSLSDDEDSNPGLQTPNTGQVPSSLSGSPDSLQPSTISVNKNIAHLAKQYANRKKLKTEQLAEVDIFLMVRSFHMTILVLIAVTPGYS
jgi:hypothetical protein